MRIFFLTLFCALCILNKPAHADEPLANQVAQLTKTVRELKFIVERQEREINELKAEKVSVSQAPVPAFQPSGSKSLQGRWNPNIGAVADTVLKLDSPKEDAVGADRLSVRELELILGSAVDPYSRLDATISFSDFEDASLEEAYYTHFGLPWDMTARLGRFKPYIGKAIPIHRDSLDTVDEPLVIQRYFGIEAYTKSGIDFKKPLDLPFGTHEIALGVLEGGNGEDGTLFGNARRRPTIYSHLKNYFDVNDVTGLELGASYLVGSKDEDASFEVNVLGFDGTMIYRFADQRHLKLQGEAFYVNREDFDNNRHLWGGYALLDFRFDPRWAAGFRFDDVELVNNPVKNPNSVDVGYTGYLTFYQSEFARWRAQFTHLDLANGQDDNQFLLQGTFAIGEHKHKLQ